MVTDQFMIVISYVPMISLIIFCACLFFRHFLW